MFVSICLSCSDHTIEEHLIQLNKINNQIDTDDWQVTLNAHSETESFFGLRKQVSDTIISLGFSCLRKDSGIYYIIDGFTKSFENDDLYHEWSMYNYDTLYFFRRRIGLKNDSVHLVPIDSLDFTVGKYYYLYLHNGVNLAQQQYFMVHKDSLLKIRGNNLPNLPEDKYDGSTSSPHWFLDERSGLLYDMISGKIVRITE